MAKIKKERDRYLFGGMLGYDIVLLLFVLSNFNDKEGYTLLLYLLSVVIPCLAFGIIKVHNNVEEINAIGENIIGLGLIGTFIITFGLIFIFSKIAAILFVLSALTIALVWVQFSDK